MGAGKGRGACQPWLLVRALTQGIELQVAPDAEAAARRIVYLFIELSPSRIGLSGGSTPRRAYELLSESDLDLSRCDVFLVDERWVPKDDERSNSLMIGELLASKSQARFHVPEFGESLEQSATAYAAELEPFVPLDLVLLGLGEDGHTASLFPGGPELMATDIVTTSQGPDSERITMTLECLNQSSVALFLVTGESKREAVQRLVLGEDIPASRVRPKQRLILVCDEPAMPDAIA